MNILCITHADFETPGIITQWANDHDYHFTVCKPYKNERLPLDNTFDILIIMGGPQSATNLDATPYLHDEINLIQAAILNNKKVLGFCLGAQLIGAALGAKTLRSPEKEVGVFPITLTPNGMTDPLLQGLPHSFPVIHWHNDMPGLTKNSTVLAQSVGCPRQIIHFQHLVYGFQCHLEVDSVSIAAMINACPEDLNPSLFTQNRETLLAQDYVGINQMMCQLLDRFVGL